MDTATVDKGVARPWGIDLPAFLGDGVIEASFIDTTHCDAIAVEFQWAASYDFTGGSFVSIGPIGIHDEDSVSGVYYYSNPDDGICHDIDTLHLTLNGLYETEWFIRARFIDQHGNISRWSDTLVTRIDNTAPTTSRVSYVKSIADSTNRVDVKIGWNPDEIADAGIGVEGVNIFRSNTPGVIGSPIGTVTRFDSTFIDTDPDPGDNWHDNVYTIVPYDFLGHENSGGGQGYFQEVGGRLDYHPPVVPRIDSVVVSHYLDEFTIFWSDSGPCPLTNRYVMLHAGNEDWLWLGDTLLAPIERLGISPFHKQTFPIDVLIGGTRHYFMMCAEDADDPVNQSGWSEVLDFELPDALVESTTISISAGWNLISLPVMPSNNRGGVLFPGNLGIYEWNTVGDSNDVVEYLEPGHAYWVLMSSGADYDLTGIPVIRVEKDITIPGWWTFGAPFDTSSTDDGSGYEYSGTGWAANLTAFNTETGLYYDDDKLHEGRGYWLMVTGTGEVFSETGMAKQLPDKSGLEWIFTFEACDVSLEIGSSPEASQSIDMADIVMPPPPPNGENLPYLRGDDGFRYRRSITPDGTWEITAPLSTELRWDSESIPDCGLTLFYNGRSIDMRMVNSIVISGHARIVAGDLPVDYSLGCARPNPFNPTCEIPFALPTEGRVRINIYDITGHQVVNLIDKDIPAGEHSIIWNGTDDSGRDLPAGIYLCRMSVEGFSATQRMLLVK